MIKAKFTTYVGGLMRRSFRSELKRARFQYSNHYRVFEWDEDKGWLDSTFFITIEGTPAFVDAFNKWIHKLEETS